MARSVKVVLQAVVGQYKRGLGEAERATDKLSDAIDGIDGKPLDDAADKAKGLGDSVDDAADRAARDFDEIGRHAKELDRKISDTESGMRSLAKAFADTGDPKILAAWKQQGQVLGDLRNVRKMLPDPAEVGQAGLSLGRKLGDGILKSVPPQMSQAIFLGAAAGAPLAASTIIGAITGGAALGGIGAGIALSMKDPKIKAQAKELGDTIGSYMRDSAAAFGEAMPDAIGKARTLVGSLQTDLERMFTSSAGYLGPFIDQVAPGIQAIVAGLSSIVQKAGPTLAVIGSGLTGILEQVGIFMEMIASNSDIGAKALNDLFAIIEFGLQTLTVSIDFLATAYKYTLGWTSLFTDADEAVDQFGKTEGKAAGTTNALGFAVEETGKKVEVAKTKFVALNDQIAQTVERNMSAAEANISMRAAVKTLTDAIDKKAKVTDDERTALIGFARTTNSATKALDEQGRTVGAATKAHEANRKKLIETAIKMGYTRGEAKKLANQYLAIPKGVATGIQQPGMKQSRDEVKRYHGQLDRLTRKIKTSITVEGDDKAYAKLKRLLVAQQAAKKGISVSAANSAFNKNAGYHTGGWTGPGAKMQPAGIVHADEFVVKKSSRRKIERTNPGLLDELNATGQLPGHAAGGMVMPVRVNASMTKVISMAEALSKVAPSFGNWPSSPSAQRGDSGVWRKVVQLIKSGPKQGSFGNAYRPGDPKWHGSGRAVDWMGYNMDALAKYLAAKRPLELIHRTRNRDYAYTRGRNMGSFNSALMNAHKNHVHVAMANGGVIPEPVIGVGASGRSYSFAERGPERVLSTGQTMASANSGRVVQMTLAPVFNISGSNMTAQQLSAQVNRDIGAQFNQLVRGISS
jgi:hypothetical protein